MGEVPGTVERDEERRRAEPDDGAAPEESVPDAGETDQADGGEGKGDSTVQLRVKGGDSPTTMLRLPTDSPTRMLRLPAVEDKVEQGQDTAADTADGDDGDGAADAAGPEDPRLALRAERAQPAADASAAEDGEDGEDGG
ncbi:hypothetical protein [Peterkaempfera griseoplana]|uniref:hypothetical protein n=1 Tax=Peterkaempfera griseoplana TaxID=66896 RepID=UPI0006E3BEFA|nr:hypothetical protein [Peterkaempfera griseoplana]